MQRRTNVSIFCIHMSSLYDVPQSTYRGRVEIWEVHTVWQRPLYGVYTIMMGKLAKDGDGGDARPPPFTLFTIMFKVAVDSPAVIHSP
jgi:hypothetical protein